ncbi:hypothetical protein NM688_g3252 [Phlebia brevispora]|uniref:Uncharacterized protein n=1 Tax=Phlebia brevispora TaxID=194682 RepID=A0ACC1T604_9APHY|nr:hypothetical protein NM688_g3252 [Phlebia brevispora]
MAKLLLFSASHSAHLNGLISVSPSSAATFRTLEESLTREVPKEGCGDIQHLAHELTNSCWTAAHVPERRRGDYCVVDRRGPQQPALDLGVSLCLSFSERTIPAYIGGLSHVPTHSSCSCLSYIRAKPGLGGAINWLGNTYTTYKQLYHTSPVSTRADMIKELLHTTSIFRTTENIMKCLYLYLAHVKGSAAAPLLAFSISIMHMSETLLYLFQESVSETCTMGGNSVLALIFYHILPYCLLQLAFPSLIALYTSKDIIRSLRVAHVIE